METVQLVNAEEKKKSKLLWHCDDSSVFRMSPTSTTTIHAKLSLRSADGSIIVNIVHTPEIGDDQRLGTVAAAAVVGDENSGIYLLNAFDGSLERVDVKTTMSEFMTSAIAAKIKVTDVPVSTRLFVNRYRATVEKCVNQHMTNMAAAVALEDDDVEDVDIELSDDGDENM
jgi:hypothetical protein